MAAAKSTQADSSHAYLDTDNDGIITDKEIAYAKEVAIFEHRRRMQENADKKEDQIRSMAWFALWGMLLYPILIVVTSLYNMPETAELIADIASTYFIAIAGLVAAFFGAQAYRNGR